MPSTLAFQFSKQKRFIFFMKKLNTLFAVLFSLVLLQVNAQEGRFLEEVFDDVTVTSGVMYGVNATLIGLLDPDNGINEAIPEPLMADVYEPVGDEFGERPLVVLMHTGNFLPTPTNGGITGTRADSSAVEICTRLAKMGYVAASIDYRLGWNPLAASQPERALGLIQAAYRGVQDSRTAIRFFKSSVDGGNPYQIDSTRITLWGNGTGGYIALGAATLDNYNEILTTTNGPAKFLLDADGDGAPDTPMVIEAMHGDVEGKTVGVGQPPFTPLPGDTLCYPNHVDYSSDFQLCVNVGGDLGDISWLDVNSPPMITFQSAFDFFAPYNDGVLVVPTTQDPIVRVQGGQAVIAKANELGNNQAFIDANIDDMYTQRAKDNSAAAGHDYFEGLAPTVLPPNMFNLDEGVVIDWWDPNALSPVGVPWNLLPHPSGGTFHEQGLVTNFGMSAEKARANIDTIFGYFTPRAYAALNLIESGPVNVEEFASEEVNLQAHPNPANDMVMLSSAKEEPMLDVEIYDLNGRLLRAYRGIDQNYFFLYRHQLADGIYVAKVRFESGIKAKKIMFN